LSERQVQQPKQRYQPDSVAWVRHGNRGRQMPWAVPFPQQQLLDLARGKYAGFNDSHLCEKLQAEENPGVSRETVRRKLSHQLDGVLRVHRGNQLLIALPLPW
jgi:hypothetical protein